MRERLFVAEKVMKTLFKRNRELEESYIDLQNNLNSGEGQGPQKERGKEDDDGGQSKEELKERVKELEKQLE